MSIIERLYYSSPIFEWIYKKSVFSGFLYKVKQFYSYFVFKWLTKTQFKEEKLRRGGYIDSKYEKLLSLKDKYLGKRCFITCTGPSLTISDLELLKNEYVFGMNSICQIHDMTNWKPDFYGIQDGKVFEKLRSYILNTDNGVVFVPYAFKEHYNTPADWVYFHVSWAYHLYDRRYTGKFYAKFSDDCYATVYDGFSITYSLIQLAVYMGFTEIYLLGADCSYKGEKEHFIDMGRKVPDTETAMDRLFAAYREAKKFADANDIKIYNATRGGCLEIFPRVTLEDILTRDVMNKNEKK